MTQIFFKLQELKPSERVWLWRMRQPTLLPRSPGRAACATQAEVADLLGFTLYNYQQIEVGKRDDEARTLIARLCLLYDNCTAPLTPNECCLLARRRYDMKVKALAQELGVSDTRVLVLESKADKRVIDFWKAKGFTGFENVPK